MANKNSLKTGNNRIILATDGEFPVSDKTLDLIRKNAQQDIHLTVLTFGRNPLIGRKLTKTKSVRGGTYAHVTTETADLQLILEAQAKKPSEKYPFGKRLLYQLKTNKDRNISVSVFKLSLQSGSNSTGCPATTY